jgi:GNAT superfamily N-acetyltransferase
MPRPAEQPDYYAMLEDVAARSRRPGLRVLVAVDPAGAVMGSVDFIDDVRHYGAGPVAGVPDAAGVRLLGVDERFRGAGVGKALTRFCLAQARALGRKRVILHTTRAMPAAWAMYERLGFARFPEIDFRQGALDVFGFQLELDGSRLQSRTR